MHNGARRGSKGNLPADISSFVGRRAEVIEVKRLLGKARLVTLTGVGGVGKTRMALEVARGLARSFADGPWLVNLSDVEDPELLGYAVSQALGVGDQSRRPQADVLVEFFADRQALLVLDTCERLIEACSELVGRLLRDTSGLRIMATSQEPLRVAGEHILVIPPLAIRAEELWVQAPPEAMELLRVRAAAAVPGFELTPENLSAVATLVRRLDGLPLAIELAAVRLRTLTVEQITARLDDRFKLLDGSRTPVRRHQTLRSAIDWSHKLCGPQEQLLWARLTVFSGSFDLAAAERICADEPAAGLAVDEIVDRLGALVEKSIVYAVPDTDPYRFRMLDTIRDYGAERLSELGESHTLRRRHRDHYASLVRQAERAWTGHDQVRWFECLRGDYANVWAALDFCLNEPGELATGQDMAARLWFFWIACGFLREGRHYLEKALARQDHHPDPQRDPARRKAMWACAFIAGTQGDLDAARELANRCQADASAASDTLLTAYAVETQGMVAAIRGDLDQGVSQLTEALDYYRGLDEIDAGLLRTMPTLGITLVMRGDLDGALALARECRPLCEAHGELWQRSYVDYLEGLALRGKGDPALATARVRPAVEVKLGFHDIVGLVMCIELLAGCAADLDDGPRAGRLLGATQEIWRMFGLPAFGSPFHSTEHQRSEERARELLGESGFERALQAGRGLSLDEVVAYAVGQSPRSGPRKARAVRARPGASSTATTPLTRREAEIADLVAQGLSNRDIAARLVIAKRTVDSHVEHILVKLGFSARTQIAVWAVSHRDADPGGPG